MIDWPETRLQLQLWLHQSWPFHVLAWLLSKRVSESQGFGKFGDNEMEPITAVQHEVIKDAEPAQRGTVIESLLPDDAEALSAKKAQRRKHLKTVLAISAGAAGVACFLIAVVALYFRK